MVIRSFQNFESRFEGPLCSLFPLYSESHPISVSTTERASSTGVQVIALSGDKKYPLALVQNLIVPAKRMLRQSYQSSAPLVIEIEMIHRFLSNRIPVNTR
jgi:hypothetical protein